jgi:pimeloyl-ACP methyl ester carboxylesterase
MFRTRFKNEIVAEFLPPSRPRKKQKLIILCDGMPSIPRKQPLSEFLAAKGFWVIYPRYRGAWESGGEFLSRSPHEDILDVLDELPKELEEIAFGQRFRLAPHQVFVIGGSFGGAAAILLSLDHRVTRVVANCPVVDWSILDELRRPRLRNRTTPTTSAKRSGMGIGSRTRTGASFEAVRSTIRGTTETRLTAPRC